MKDRKWWFLSSLVFFALVAVVLVLLEDSAEIMHEKKEQYLPPVSVTNPQPGSHTGVLQVNAEIKPHWSITVKSQVSGECVKVTDKALAGQRVEQGELLIGIEGSPYLVLVHEAEQELSQAKLNLLLEQKKAIQAERDWKRSGVSKTPSALALNKPQLEVAKQAVKVAKSRLKAARKNYANTQIKAPFSGLVTERYISIGQAVTEGEALLHLIQSTQQEVIVALSKSQWNMLAEGRNAQPVSIRNDAGSEIGQAQIKRGGGFLDPETRQYKLFLEIDGNPNAETLAGDFVRLQLPARIVHNALSVPESALTQDGYIWYVDDMDRLRKFNASVLFHQDDQVVIATPSTEVISDNYPSSWRITTTPLASFLAGMSVRPIMVGVE